MYKSRAVSYLRSVHRNASLRWRRSRRWRWWRGRFLLPAGTRPSPYEDLPPNTSEQTRSRPRGWTPLQAERKIGETQLIIKIILKPFKVKCITGAHHVLLHLPVVWWATALANMVLPQPGGPYIRTPLGGSMPIWGKSQKAEYDRVVRDKKISHVTSFVYICCTVIVDKHLHAFLPPSGRSCVLQSTCIPQWVFFKLSWS